MDHWRSFNCIFELEMELAGASHRDQSSVSKDVARLQSLGLVRVEFVANAGHGRKKLVTPDAETISINANFAMA